jgi:hypothetical protein
MLMLMVVIFLFSVFGATVFTQPTIAQVEEVSSLVHRSLLDVDYVPDVCSPSEQITDRRTHVDYRKHATSFYLRESGESINLTGTLNRCPSRSMRTCTVSPI